jgi:hypothetical protein
VLSSLNQCTSKVRFAYWSYLVGEVYILICQDYFIYLTKYDIYFNTSYLGMSHKNKRRNNVVLCNEVKLIFIFIFWVTLTPLYINIYIYIYISFEAFIQCMCWYSFGYLWPSITYMSHYYPWKTIYEMWYFETVAKYNVMKQQDLPLGCILRIIWTRCNTLLSPRWQSDCTNDAVIINSISN